MFGAPETPQQKTNHPVSQVFEFLLNWVGMIFIMGIILWMVTSLIVPTSFIAWSASMDRKINEAINGWSWSEEQQGFAIRLGYQVSAYVNPLVDPAFDPTARSVEHRVQEDRRNGENSYADELNNRFHGFLHEHVWPKQVHYMPLYVSRSIILAGVLVFALMLFWGAFYAGQHDRRERQKIGELPKPHRYILARQYTVFGLSLLFAYPFIPLPLPTVIVVPLMIAQISYGFKRFSARMVDF